MKARTLKPWVKHAIREILQTLCILLLALATIVSTYFEFLWSGYCFSMLIIPSIGVILIDKIFNK
jgi:hypothetical protein